MHPADSEIVRKSGNTIGRNDGMVIDSLETLSLDR